MEKYLHKVKHWPLLVSPVCVLYSVRSRKTHPRMPLHWFLRFHHWRLEVVRTQNAEDLRLITQWFHAFVLVLIKVASIYVKQVWFKCEAVAQREWDERVERWRRRRGRGRIHLNIWIHFFSFVWLSVLRYLNCKEHCSTVGACSARPSSNDATSSRKTRILKIQKRQWIIL